MTKLYILPLFLSFLFLSAKAQLFIDDGTNGTLSIRNAASGTLGSYDNTNTTVALFVDGNITLEGTYDNNSCESQLTGNISKTASATFTSTGDEVFVSAPNATITTSSNQRITGTFTGTNDFYNLITHKVATQYVELANTIEVENTIKFNNLGRIRTDITGHTNDGSAYPYEIYLKNGATASLVGNSTGNGATEKYIEGKLRRKANATGVFYYPIGVAPTSLDGMEAFELNFTSNPNMDFIGYIKPATVTPITRNILCDVGKDPGPGQQNYSGCVGSPDGIFDWYILETSMDLSHEWIATPSGSTTGYAYGITLHPGNGLDVNNASNYYTIPNACGAPYQTQRIRVMAKDGVIGGNAQVAPTTGGNWAPFMHLTSYLWCQFDNADLDLTLNNQTSFSSFRIHGTQLNAQTVLPIELVELKAEPINNTYIKVSWSTASEINNKGFEVLRSTDGINFSSIGFVNGNGTSNQIHSYQLDDYNVQTGNIYYYKLKQVDFDDSYSYTYVVSASLNPSDVFAINEIYPNPVTAESFVNVYSPSDNRLSFSIYNDIGQELTNKELQLNKGNNIIELPTNGLAKATYIITFKHQNNIYNRKIVKL